MSQPPGAPPEQWEPRKDAISRKVIEELHTSTKVLTVEIQGLKDNTVTYKALMGSLAVFITLLATVMAVINQFYLGQFRAAGHDHEARMQALEAADATRDKAASETFQLLHSEHREHEELIERLRKKTKRQP